MEMSWIEDWLIHASEQSFMSSKSSVLSSSLKEETIEDLQDESLVDMKNLYDSERGDDTPDVSLESVDKSSSTSFSSHWVNSWAVALTQEDSILEISSDTEHVIDIHEDCWANCSANRWGQPSSEISFNSDSSPKSVCSTSFKSGSTISLESTTISRDSTCNETINIDEGEGDMGEDVQVLGNIDALPQTFRLFTAGCKMSSTGIFK